MQALDIQTQSAEEFAVSLDRYLSYGNTASGHAAHHAKEDLDRRMGQDKAREAIPRAWAELVEADSGGRLVALLEEATAALADNAPARADVIEYLRRLAPADSPVRRRPKRTRASSAESLTAKAPRSALPVMETPTPSPQHRVAQPTSAGDVRYYLFGEERAAKNPRGAYVAIFRGLAERDPGFLSQMEPKLRGRKNRGIARSKQELATNETMVKSAVALAGGWWLLSHLSNKDKIRHLRIACEVAGIPFGKRAGLHIDLPNA